VVIVLVEIRNISSAKPEVELIVTITPMENIFNVKYCENVGAYRWRM